MVIAGRAIKRHIIHHVVDVLDAVERVRGQRKVEKTQTRGCSRHGIVRVRSIWVNITAIPGSEHTFKVGSWP